MRRPPPRPARWSSSRPRSTASPRAIRISYTIHFQPQTAHPPETSDGGAPSDAAAPDAAPADAAAQAPPAVAPAPARVVVRGQIRERGTREPLVGADVALIRRGAASGAADRQAEVIGATDDDGRFEVRVGEPGALRVIVSDTAHESCVRDFAAGELAGSTPVEWSCFAPKRAGGLNETRVRARPEHPEETKETLTRAELTTVPGTLGDPLRVLQNMPGVARAPFGLGLLIVRGANPSDTGVFIGGEPIPVLYHFLAGPSVFTANLIDKIDFYPGGFGVRYGRYMGGVVDVARQERRRPHAARRGRHQPARFIGLRRRSGAGRRAHQLRVPAQLHRRAVAAGAALHRADARGFDVLHRRAGVLGLSGARGQGSPGRRAGRR